MLSYVGWQRSVVDLCDGIEPTLSEPRPLRSGNYEGDAIDDGVGLSAGLTAYLLAMPCQRSKATRAYQEVPDLYGRSPLNARVP